MKLWDIWRTAAAGLLLGVTVLGLSACNTIDGAGKDIEAAGEEIQEAAD